MILIIAFVVIFVIILIANRKQSENFDTTDAFPYGNTLLVGMSLSLNQGLKNGNNILIFNQKGLTLYDGTGNIKWQQTIPSTYKKEIKCRTNSSGICGYYDAPYLPPFEFKVTADGFYIKENGPKIIYNFSKELNKLILADDGSLQLLDNNNNIQWFFPMNKICTSITDNHVVNDLIKTELTSRQRLVQCQMLSDGKNKLIMQSDGNLVLYDGSGNTKWQSGKPSSYYPKNTPYYWLVYESNNNLVVYDIANDYNVIWQSHTNELNLNKFILSNDCTLKLLDNNNVVWMQPPPPNGYIFPYGNKMTPGQRLFAGQYILNGTSKLIMQQDGNLVLYNNDVISWQSNTINTLNSPYKLPYFFIYHSQGNLIIYDTNNVAVWESHTSGVPSDSLTLTNNGYLKLTKSNNTVIQWIKPDCTGPNNPNYTFQSKSLSKGDELHQCQGIQTNNNKLVMQSDGNIVLYDAGGNNIWTNTVNTGTYYQPYKFVYDTNSYVGIFDQSNLTWNSSTSSQWFNSNNLILDDTSSIQTVFYDANKNKQITWINPSCNGSSNKNYTFPYGNTLPRTKYLLQCQGLKNGNYTLMMQSDGNLVLYNNNMNVWQAGRQGKNMPYYFIFNYNGDLGVYDKSDNLLWNCIVSNLIYADTFVLENNGYMHFKFNNISKYIIVPVNITFTKNTIFTLNRLDTMNNIKSLKIIGSSTPNIKNIKLNFKCNNNTTFSIPLNSTNSIETTYNINPNLSSSSFPINISCSYDNPTSQDGIGLSYIGMY